MEAVGSDALEMTDEELPEALHLLEPSPSVDATMPAKISISDCRVAIRRANGIPLVSRGTTTLITTVAVQGQGWVNGRSG